LIANVLALNQNDIDSLLETSEILEINAARLAAIQRHNPVQAVAAMEIHMQRPRKQFAGLTGKRFMPNQRQDPTTAK
jgi:DNA-binding FadR family transcriptional regulator